MEIDVDARWAESEAVVWRSRYGTIHLGARIAGGPLLTAEGCQKDDAVVEIIETKRVGKLLRIASADGPPCVVCIGAAD